MFSCRVVSSVMKFTLSQRTSISLTRISLPNNLVRLNSICISISSEKLPMLIDMGKMVSLWMSTRRCEKGNLWGIKALKFQKPFLRILDHKAEMYFWLEFAFARGGFALKCFWAESSLKCYSQRAGKASEKIILSKSTLQPCFSMEISAL